MATPIDFSKYVLNGLKIENLTQDILLGHAFNLLKGTCSSSPLGHQTVAADYFFNDDLEYLKTFDPEVTYTTSIMKTKAARYEIKGIEDMVPTLWSTIKHVYDKDVVKGIKHWGERRKLCYRSQVSKFSKQNVYSTKAILGVKSVSVKKLHGDEVLSCYHTSSISDEVLKLKNIKKDVYTRFQRQEHYEHVGPEVTRSQEVKRSQDDEKRLCLVDDLKKFKIIFMSSQRYKPKPKVKDHYINSQVND
ncbi:hypothetical protein Tco_0869950 [Tanacetum coccineum]